MNRNIDDDLPAAYRRLNEAGEFQRRNRGWYRINDLRFAQIMWRARRAMGYRDD